MQATISTNFIFLYCTKREKFTNIGFHNTFLSEPIKVPSQRKNMHKRVID